MTLPPTSSSDFLLSIHLGLSQYPILSSRIRSRMRKRLIERGIIDRVTFEARARKMAIRSQKREGLLDPLYEEPAPVWDQRLAKVRDYLTDLLFSQRLTFEEFSDIVNQVLLERGVAEKDNLLSINPELSPIEKVFEQAMTIERLPYEERSKMEARLLECKVVLIRSLISDQLRYINIAKEWFTIEDLAEIYKRKIGGGKIGGKAAGMLLAIRILRELADEELLDCLNAAESYYVGSDVMYSFMNINNLFHWNDQKYKTEEEMRVDYPLILEDFESGEFPPDVLERLQGLLASVRNRPMIVRSSSLLEDNFGTAFAGKYESVFLPNQATQQENLRALTRAIGRIFGSTLNPNALVYRASKGLADYDERMAVLIQVVQGEQFGRYYLPHAAGVAFSRNLYRWSPQINREDGFVRMVWGMGTRAVDRVGNDYPRLVALSHPTLRPSTNVKAISQYSQRYVDLIDLQENRFHTLPIHDVLTTRYPPVRYLAQVEEDGYFLPLRSALMSDPKRLVLTFDELLKRTSFARHMRTILRTLETQYRAPVDLEFTLGVSDNSESAQPDLCITVLQCRPQSHLIGTAQRPFPEQVNPEQVIFRTHFMVPEGFVDEVDYVLFVPPHGYFALPTLNARHELSHAIGRVNRALEGKRYISVGPGRWGSSNSDLGVPIGYGDIYNTRALVELAGKDVGPEPEPSLGTHFFQDLLEAQIYPLAVMLDDEKAQFNRAFFYEAHNCLDEFVDVDEKLCGALRLIRVADFAPGTHLTIVMSDEKNQALAYLNTNPL